MIQKLKGDFPIFVLDTARTTYVFAVTPSGHLEHLYYGGRIALSNAADCDVFREKREFETGNSIAYSKEHPTVLLEDMCLEFSAAGHGDVREPFLSLVRADGSRSCDFSMRMQSLTVRIPIFLRCRRHTQRMEKRSICASA